ncbi:cytosine permease [Bifidobacterium sp. ESL0690]|uniref:cytosine permease n=1 Tax=Bifidobacterium sp. ESL0690 TaxID=2983214 RepID=UPI0023F6725C|nr:cytosine permease [Bifidobacterium sp. ESL0690]WEV45911.1 cytosine permease [Bifidobacterium sp. ESL0690]
MTTTSAQPGIDSSEGSEAEYKENSLYVPQNQRRNWWSIALIWIGQSINVSTLMTGAILGAGLTLRDAFLAALIGFGIIEAYMCFVAMEATDTGLPTSAMSSAALGRKGGRYVISIIIGISLIGWFSVQAAVCGSSFSLMAAKFGWSISPQICEIVLGLLMLITAVLGFDGVKWVNYIAAPLLFIICVYGLFTSVSTTGMSSLFSYVPKQSIGLVAGINIAVGFFAVGGATVGDFSRYAKDRKGAVLSSIIGIWPPMVILLVMGAMLAIVKPESGGDISKIMASMGLAGLALIALVMSTWSVNVSNAYSAGLAFAVIADKGDKGYKVSTTISGILGIILAVAGIMDYFQLFLTVLSAMIPALAGAMIADYWLVRKARPENFKPLDGFSVPGLVSFIGGSIVALITGGTFASVPALSFLDHPFFLGPVNGIVVSILLYVLVYKAMKLPAFPGAIQLTRKGE